MKEEKAYPTTPPPSHTVLLLTLPIENFSPFPTTRLDTPRQQKQQNHTSTSNCINQQYTSVYQVNIHDPNLRYINNKRNTFSANQETAP
jgi:hypothetical protein